MRGSTFMLIYIPKTGAGRGGRVRVGVNGKIMDLPVGIDFDADAPTIEALVNARIDYALSGTNGVPDGQILIEGSGSRVRGAVNGEVFTYPTNLPFLPSVADLQKLVAAFIAYLSGTGVTPPPTPTPTPTPAPVFSIAPSYAPLSGAVGDTFSANNGLASNTTSYSRRHLLGGTAIGTGGTITPNAAGQLILEVTATGPTGLTTIAYSPALTVAATAPAYTPSLDFSDARNSMYLGSVI